MNRIILVAFLLAAVILAGCSEPIEGTDAPEVGDGYSTFHRTIEGHDCLFLQFEGGQGNAALYAITKVQCDGKW